MCLILSFAAKDNQHGSLLRSAYAASIFTVCDTRCCVPKPLALTFACSSSEPALPDATLVFRVQSCNYVHRENA